MSEAYPRLVLELLVGMEALDGDGADEDQVLHWMAGIGDAIEGLDPGEREQLVFVTRSMAAEAEASGDAQAAERYRRAGDMAAAAPG